VKVDRLGNASEGKRGNAIWMILECRRVNEASPVKIAAALGRLSLGKGEGDRKAVDGTFLTWRGLYRLGGWWEKGSLLLDKGGHSHKVEF